MRKTKIFLIIISILMVMSIYQSCNKDESLLSFTSEEVLISPNGEKLFNSINELKLIIEDDIFISYNEHLKYAITKIEFLRGLDKGCAALITYKLKDGGIRNFALNKGVKFETIGAVLTNKITAASKKEAVYRVKCLANGGCTTEQCFAQAIITMPPEGGGSITYSCSCAECILEITTP